MEEIDASGAFLWVGCVVSFWWSSCWRSWWSCTMQFLILCSLRWVGSSWQRALMRRSYMVAHCVCRISVVDVSTGFLFCMVPELVGAARVLFCSSVLSTHRNLSFLSSNLLSVVPFPFTKTPKKNESHLALWKRRVPVRWYQLSNMLVETLGRVRAAVSGLRSYGCSARGKHELKRARYFVGQAEVEGSSPRMLHGVHVFQCSVSRGRTQFGFSPLSLDNELRELFPVLVVVIPFPPSLSGGVIFSIPSKLFRTVPSWSLRHVEQIKEDLLIERSKAGVVHACVDWRRDGYCRTSSGSLPEFQSASPHVVQISSMWISTSTSMETKLRYSTHEGKCLRIFLFSIYGDLCWSLS